MRLTVPDLESLRSSALLDFDQRAAPIGPGQTGVYLRVPPRLGTRAHKTRWLIVRVDRPSTTLDPETTAATFSENAPFCQAVVTVAARAGVAEVAASTAGGTTERAAAAMTTRSSF